MIGSTKCESHLKECSLHTPQLLLFSGSTKHGLRLLIAFKFTKMKFLHIFAFFLCVSVGKLNTLVTCTSSAVTYTFQCCGGKSGLLFIDAQAMYVDKMRISKDQELILAVPFCFHSFYEPISKLYIEGTRFGKILTCFPQCCSLSVNFVYQFARQFALTSCEYQMLSARCFLFFLIVSVYSHLQCSVSLLCIIQFTRRGFQFLSMRRCATHSLSNLFAYQASKFQWYETS